MQVLSHADPGQLRGLVQRDEFFWLDLERPAQAEIDGLVDAIGLDPRAAERALRFGDQPEKRRFPRHVGLVFYGAEDADHLVETHVYVSGEWVVTVRERDCRALAELRTEL